MKLSAWCQFITAISYTACGRRAKLAIPILIVLLSTLSLTARANETPNILFILSDDIGWGDIRSYNPESKVALPAIEQLAAEGLKFTDAHTSASKCAPSRYSVITGNYQWRGRKEWGQWNATGGSQILSGQQTLGGMLQQAGYKSAFVGKHHLGAEYYRQNSNEFTNQESLIDFSRTVEEGPLQRGFD
ncbi:MAG: sulfatase-like hydrolase/transferase, partial [Woeseiales bacterium]